MKNWELRHKDPAQQVELVRGLSHLGAAWTAEDGKMFAFLTVFHPELPIQTRLDLAREVKVNQPGKGGR